MKHKEQDDNAKQEMREREAGHPVIIHGLFIKYFRSIFASISSQKTLERETNFLPNKLFVHDDLISAWISYSTSERKCNGI